MTEVEAAGAPALRRRLPWAIAVGLLALTGWGAWWLLGSSPVVGDGGFGLTLHDVQPGEVRSVGVALLCLDGAGEVTVEDVTVDAAGLTVSDFAVRLRPEPPATAFGGGGPPLRQAASGWERTFRAQCADGAVAEVAVDLVRGELGPAHTEDVDIHWSAGVRSGVHTVPVAVTLCAEGQVDEYCEADAPPLDGVR